MLSCLEVFQKSNSGTHTFKASTLLIEQFPSQLFYEFQFDIFMHVYCAFAHIHSMEPYFVQILFPLSIPYRGKCTVFSSLYTLSFLFLLLLRQGLTM